MEALFNNNIVFVFFFAMLAIFDYSSIKEKQKIAIIYLTVYALIFMNIIGIKMALFLLVSSMFTFFEILTEDDTKFKIIVNPIYKVIDCLYISLFQYSFLKVIISIVLCLDCFNDLFVGSNFIFSVISAIFIIMAITSTLQQKFTVNSINEMYRVFRDFPINKVDFNDKLDDACKILVSIEDSTYYTRKGYTFMSFDFVINILKNRLGEGTFKSNVRYMLTAGTQFAKNVLSEKRGYSTIPMQLVRSLGIKRGYNYKYRRKIYELIYSKIFFDGINKMFIEDQVVKREHIKTYYLYIYFHTVNTFLGDAKFSKFLNAFDMQYNKRNEKDIYECSNEGIFIGCMGLSKRASIITQDNIEYYVFKIKNIELDKVKICDMVQRMMSKPYNGNYLE